MMYDDPQTAKIICKVFKRIYSVRFHKADRQKSKNVILLSSRLQLVLLGNTISYPVKSDCLCGHMMACVYCTSKMLQMPVYIVAVNSQ